jgi:hypothetical protein
MPEWSVLQWLDAGTTPLLIIIALGLWRLDRRLLRVEVILDIKKGAPP